MIYMSFTFLVKFQTYIIHKINPLANALGFIVVVQACYQMKWVCVQVANHKRVAKTIQDHEEKGWFLHTYQVAPMKDGVYHYLLFEKQAESWEI